MATDVKNPTDANTTSTTELVTGIISDAQDLMKQQFDLLRHEVLDDIRKTRDAAIFFGIGAGLVLVAAILGMMMLVHLLPWLFPDLPLWGSFGIWTAIMVVTAVVLFTTGVHKLPSSILPEKTAQALKENIQWITKPK